MLFFQLSHYHESKELQSPCLSGKTLNATKLTHLCPKSSSLPIPSNYFPPTLSSMPIKGTPNVLFESLLKCFVSMADNHMELFLLWLFGFCQNQSLTPRVNSPLVQHQHPARAKTRSLSTKDIKALYL